MCYQLLIELIKLLSVLIASGIAIYGIDSWRRETKWKRQYELAEEVLSAFYEVRDSLRIIRSPFSFEGEGRSRVRSENESADESKSLDNAYILTERFNKERSSFEKIQKLKYRFIAIFGTQNENIFLRLNEIVNEMFQASNMLKDYFGNKYSTLGMNDSERKEYFKDSQKYRTIVWSIGENNEIDQKINSIISEIEIICKNIISRK